MCTLLDFAFALCSSLHLHVLCLPWLRVLMMMRRLLMRHDRVLGCLTSFHIIVCIVDDFVFKLGNVDGRLLARRCRPKRPKEYVPITSVLVLPVQAILAAAHADAIEKDEKEGKHGEDCNRYVEGRVNSGQFWSQIFQWIECVRDTFFNCRHFDVLAGKS